MIKYLVKNQDRMDKQDTLLYIMRSSANMIRVNYYATCLEQELPPSLAMVWAT